MFCKQDTAKPGNVFCLSVECSAACTGRVTIQSSIKLGSSHIHRCRKRELGGEDSFFNTTLTNLICIKNSFPGSLTFRATKKHVDVSLWDFFGFFFLLVCFS